MKDNYGDTAIVVAARCANIDALYLLLQQGIDVESKDEKGNTLLILAVRENPSIQALQATALLLEAGADVQQSIHEGETAIMVAADWLPAMVRFSKHSEPHFPQSDMELVEKLLDYGADPSARDYEGRTPRTRCFKIYMTEALYQGFSTSEFGSVSGSDHTDGDREHGSDEGQEQTSDVESEISNCPTLSWASTREIRFAHGEVSQEDRDLGFGIFERSLPCFYEVMSNFPHDLTPIHIPDLWDIVIGVVLMRVAGFSRAEVDQWLALSENSTELSKTFVAIPDELTRCCDLLNSVDLRRESMEMGRSMAREMGWLYEPTVAPQWSGDSFVSHAPGDVTLPTFSSARFYRNLEWGSQSTKDEEFRTLTRAERLSNARAIRSQRPIDWEEGEYMPDGRYEEDTANSEDGKGSKDDHNSFSGQSDVD